MSLLDEVLAAHGGLGAWRSATEVEVDLRSGGLALKSKFAAGPFKRYTARISMHEPRTVLLDYPKAGSEGVFEGDRVRITGQDPADREDPRRHFPGGRRALWWDRLDALYFAGYALWNYFTTPYLLTRIETREDGRRLHAVFPPDVPTHCREQTFHFDERGLLERLDYTAEVFGGWAKAQHVCREHRTFDGLVLPTWRRVTPVGRSQPTIVRIEVDAARVTRS